MTRLSLSTALLRCGESCLRWSTLVVCLVFAGTTIQSASAQTSAGTGTSSEKPCPKDIYLDPRIGTLRSFVDQHGDVNVTVVVAASPGSGGFGICSAPRDPEIIEIAAADTRPAKAKKDNPPPDPDPCPPPDSNNLGCVEMTDGSCFCEIDLKPKPRGAFGSLGTFSPLAFESDTGGYWRRAPRGDGLVVYEFWDTNFVKEPRMEVRDVSGEISVYEITPTGSGSATFYRLVEHVDPHDNTTRYEYDSKDRITAVHRPDGISELWNYDQTQLSWIGGSSGWNANDYTGIEITYFDNVAQQPLPQFTSYMVFRKVGSQGPLVKDRLYRIYRPKSEVLDGPQVAGGPHLYDCATAQMQRHRVTQFTYYQDDPLLPPLPVAWGGSQQLLVKIESLIADGVLPSATESGLITEREFEWVLPTGGDRYRVHREHFSLFGRTVEYSYVLDASDARRADQITQTDSDGTTTVTSFDDYLRPTQVVVTPLNTAVGRPRAFDTADNGGIVEPLSITTNYTYGTCTSCSSKPTRIEVLPSGRIHDFTYDQNTGLLTSETVPDPSGGTSGATTTYVWAPLISGDTFGTHALQSVTRPDTSQFTYSYQTVGRPVPVGSRGRGLKISQQSSQSSTVAQGSASYVMTEETNYHTGGPSFDSNNRQDGLVGYVTSAVDGDAVTTTYSHNALGFLTGYTRTGLSESVATTIVPGRTGLPTQITSQAGTSYALTQNLSYNGDESLAGIATTVGLQTPETEYYYDMWGNLAVRRERNQGPQGTAPDDFNPVAPRGDVAREWIRSETHFLGSLPVASLQDRRALDRDDAGVLADDSDARFSHTTFVHDALGRVASIGYSNGASLDLTYDGYGSLYMTELSGPSQAALVTKRFVNDALELVREVRGTSATVRLITELTRNGAGRITSVVEPEALNPPSNSVYPWTLERVRREFDYDSMARVTSERLLPQGGSVFRDKRTTYDVLGRVRQVGIHEGTSTTPSQVYTSVWAGLTQLMEVSGPGGRSDSWYYDGLARQFMHQAAPGGNATLTIAVFADGTDFVEQSLSAGWDDLAIPQTHVVRTTEYARDVLGRVLEVRQEPTSSNPLVHKFSYYTTGDTASYEDPLGKVEKYLPDAIGRLCERFRPQGDAIWNESVHTDWAADARTSLLQTDGRGRETKSIYDFAGRLQVVMEPGSTTEPTAASPNQSFARFMAHNAVSQLTDIYTGNNGRIRFSYDGSGRMIMRELVTSPNPPDEHVSLAYGSDVLHRDVLGQVLENHSRYASGGIYLVEQFDRDALGRTHRERYGYETTGLANNWIDVESSFSATDPGDPVRVGLKYANNLSGGAGDLWIDHTFDLERRLTNIKWGTSATTSQLAAYKHDGSLIRQRTTTVKPSGPLTFDTTYSYDAYGRMTNIDQSFDATAGVEFVYDSASNLVKEKYAKQDGSVGDRFSYDEHNRLLTAWMGSDATHMAATDPDGGVGAYVKRLTYDLDEANNRTAVDTQAGSGGTVTSATYTTQESAPQGPSNRYAEAEGVKLWYDDRGNLIYDGLRYYVYDVLNRLTEVFLVDTGSQQAQSSQMQSAGSSMVASGAGTSSSASIGAPSQVRRLFDVNDITALAHARSQILARVDGDHSELIAQQHEPGFAAQMRQALSPTVAHQVSPSPGVGSGTFSSSGSFASSSSTAPSSSELSLTMIALYLYDAADRRVIRWLLYDRPYYYAWDGWEEAQELTLELDGQYIVRPVKQFVWGEQLDELVAYRYRPASVTATWSEGFIAEGGAHCPSRVLDAQGAVVEVQEYDPYGMAQVFHGGAAHDYSQIGNPYHWKGHRFDWETELLYMRHRYYSPSLGRFISQDPLGEWGDSGGYGNGYQYGGNNSLVREDRFGLQMGFPAGGAGGPTPMVPSAQAMGQAYQAQQRAREVKAREAAEAEQRAEAERQAAEKEARDRDERFRKSMADRPWTFAILAGLDVCNAPPGSASQALAGAELSLVLGETGLIKPPTKATSPGQTEAEAPKKNDGPEEPYDRKKHYPNTPTRSDRRAIGAGEGEVVDHDPPLVKRYYEGDPDRGERPGKEMTAEERAASAADRERMRKQSAAESHRQGGKMSHYSRMMRMMFFRK